MLKFKISSLVLFLFFVTACTITHVKRGEFEASNYSLGWERKGVDLSVKNEQGLDAKVKIGASGGAQSFDNALKTLEKFRP